MASLEVITPEDRFVLEWQSAAEYSEAEFPIDSLSAFKAMRQIAPLVVRRDPDLLESLNRRDVVSFINPGAENRQKLNDFYNQWAPLIRDIYNPKNS